MNHICFAISVKYAICKDVTLQVTHNKIQIKIVSHFPICCCIAKIYLSPQSVVYKCNFLRNNLPPKGKSSIIKHYNLHSPIYKKKW